MDPYGSKQPRGHATTVLDLVSRDDQDSTLFPLSATVTRFARDEGHRTIPFSSVMRECTFKGPAELGQRFLFELADVNCGDLLQGLFIQIKMGDWLSGIIRSNLESGEYIYKDPSSDAWTYANSLGTAILDEATLEVDDQILERITGDSVDVISTLFPDLNTQIGLADSLGKTTIADVKAWTGSRALPTEEGWITVPLLFSMLREKTTATFPLLACRSGTVRVGVTLKRFDQIVRPVSGSRTSCTDVPLNKAVKYRSSIFTTTSKYTTFIDSETGDKCYKFTTSGTIIFPSEVSCKYLLVGGGGGGSVNINSGGDLQYSFGGGGGNFFSSNSTNLNGMYTITIGSGGTALENGGSTEFNSSIATGGGGGSIGGNGGNGYGNGGKGGNDTSGTGGNGGDGLQFYGSYYGGGGGGDDGAGGGIGGLGGGGNPGRDGLVNTGGGGGGGGGAGGSGVAILILEIIINNQTPQVPPPLKQIQLLTYGVFVDGPYREMLLRQPFERPFREIQQFDFTEPLKYVINKTGNDSVVIQLPLEANQPIEEIIWIVRRKAAITLTNDWTNYSATLEKDYDPVFCPLEPLVSHAKIQANGMDIVSQPEAWFRSHIARAHKGGKTAYDSFIYGYSFARHPGQHDPTGSMNASRLNSLRLTLDIKTPQATATSSDTEWEVKVFVFAFQWVRFGNGICNKVFID